VNRWEDSNECSDGDLCTENDHCEDGECKSDPKNCNDGELCTEDSCDPYTGACVHTWDKRRSAKFSKVTLRYKSSKREFENLSSDELETILSSSLSIEHSELLVLQSTKNEENDGTYSALLALLPSQSEVEVPSLSPSSFSSSGFTITNVEEVAQEEEQTDFLLEKVLKKQPKVVVFAQKVSSSTSTALAFGSIFFFFLVMWL
jgi:hypothetical protein